MYPIIPITDSIPVPTYLLVISFAYCLGLFWLIRRADKFHLERNTALDLAFIIMISGFLGARVLHVFYEAPEYYSKNPIQFFYVWQGGFVFYGGAIAAFLGSLWFFRSKKEAVGPWADLLAPILAFGYALGRIGCFLNGCCYGTHCDLPWGVEFPNLSDSGARHPTQLYATVWELGVMAFLLLKEKANPTSIKSTGRLFAIWVSLHSIGRLLMEFLRDDDRGALVLGLTISTWISLVLLGLAIGFLAKHRKLAKIRT